MESIQEKHLESEFQALEKNNSVIPTKIAKVKKDEYHINITIPKTMFDKSIYEIAEDIEFLLTLEHNFPFTAPKLYCMTPFCKPILCDGRDLLENVMNQPWQNQFLLVEVVNNIPKFLLSYMDKINANSLPNIGQYYLDENYDLGILNSLPLFITKVREFYPISGNKEENTGRYLAISDMFFMLFDYDFFNQDVLKLTFWAHLKSLVTMKELVQEHIGTFIWKIKGGKTYSMKLEAEEIGKVLDIMLKNLMGLKIEYSVTTKSLTPKEGVLPEENIKELEKDIRDLEERIIHEDKTELVEKLMDLCERAVRYFSAINDPKYELYMEKIKNIMANEKYSQLFDKARKEKEMEEQKKIIEEAKKKLEEKKKEEEEKKEESKKEEPKKEESKKEDKKEEIKKKDKKEEKKEESKKEEKKEEDKKETLKNKTEENKSSKSVEEKKENKEDKKEEDKNSEEKEAEEMALKLLNEDNSKKSEGKSKSTVKVSEKTDFNLDFNDDDD